ncbi:MAG: hypothetical protein JJV94_03680 [Sulfurospirillum sp.]|nr:hypothetical protein [Sulfurospirillum sp.]
MSQLDNRPLVFAKVDNKPVVFAKVDNKPVVFAKVDNKPVVIAKVDNKPGVIAKVVVYVLLVYLVTVSKLQLEPSPSFASVVVIILGVYLQLIDVDICNIAENRALVRDHLKFVQTLVTCPYVYST